MPLRSTGCYTCRKRKIRCDETRPQCKKCATHGVQCPGYRDPDDDFRDQTSITAHKAEIKYRAKAADRGKWGGNGFVKNNEENGVHSTPGTLTPCNTSSRTTTGGTPPHSAAIRDLISPAAVRTQLYSTFMTIYLPQKTSRIDHFSFYELLASRRPNAISSPGEEGVETVLSSSLDALSLVTIGATSHNQTFLDQSVRAYGSALTRLRHTLTKPGALQNDDLLAATNVLGQCALYEEIAQRAQGWTAHTAGLQQLIAARGGPGSLQSPLATLMFSSLRHSALCAGLIGRKAPLMARPEWRRKAREPLVDGALQEGLMGSGERSVGFYDAAIQVPGLLERYDDLSAGMGDGSTTVRDLEGLLAECGRIERKLRDCFWGWELEHCFLQETWTYDTHEGEEARGKKFPSFFTEEPIEKFPTFCQVFPDRETFPHAYTFPSFSIAYLASLYWMCLHFLRTTVQQTHKLRHDLDQTWYPDPGEEVNEEELLELIFHLCKTIPFFCEPISGSTGHIGIFLPMRTAAIYFTQRGHWKLARWVGMIRRCVFTKGLAPPNVGNPVTR
ncbi:hypothetical protein KC363_g1033 [Hortaea werneckii]|uniref:Zn(2)-C6 fungal-type domain-containing protein n=1 Tax=Hortaea werneckii TaxID=91943 RepID=A0A3M7G488_HORWE|nr:hypothetical protein KC363_g1033 [Hortaea werneckii]KAI7505783.1 hypothetical protein KC347_g7846 [Hortaea werneckii]RMY95935.1 hypothetical protein D0861_00481 [Hortaea werneckii]